MNDFIKAGLILVPAGIAAYAAVEYARLATGTPDLDSFTFRWPALFWSKWLSSKDLPESSQPTDGTVYRVSDPRAVMLVLHNEGAYTVGSDGLYPLGGDSNTYGGPGQLLQSFAQELGYDPAEGDLRDPANTSTAVKYVVLGLIRKMVAKGTDDLPTAIRAYNGGGQAAADYLANAESFATKAYGQEV